MELNIILAGVGGQGILSIAYVLDNAALSSGYRFKQAEVHGMSQRGGAVQSHLRMSSDPIWSDLIPEGRADLVLSVEPLEALRYAHYLHPGGTVVASSSPFVNIPDYPEHESVYSRLESVPHHLLVDAAVLARRAGSARAQNMVLVGAASRLLPFEPETLLGFIRQLFERRGDRVVRINEKAFSLGRTMADLYRDGLDAGLRGRPLRQLCAAADPAAIDRASLPAWKKALDAHPALLSGSFDHTVRLDEETARTALAHGAVEPAGD